PMPAPLMLKQCITHQRQQFREPQLIFITPAPMPLINLGKHGLVEHKIEQFQRRTSQRKSILQLLIKRIHAKTPESRCVTVQRQMAYASSTTRKGWPRPPNQTQSKKLAPPKRSQILSP